MSSTVSIEEVLRKSRRVLTNICFYMGFIGMFNNFRCLFEMKNESHYESQMFMFRYVLQETTDRKSEIM